MNKMAQKIENFIFDIDGTLIDTDDSWWACMDGILGDFQPDLEQNVFDYYKEENK